MLKLFSTFAAALTLLGCSSSHAEPERTVLNDFSELVSQLNTTSEVSLYFLRSTGNYNYTSAEIKEKSGLHIRRKCGLNCSIVFNSIVEHLRGASVAVCLDGQQDALIVISDKFNVVYSYNGRFIRIENSCYFNETSISEAINISKLAIYH